MNDHLSLLLSDVFEGGLAAEHVADLRRSGLGDETIRDHRLRSVPPTMIGRLLGFDLAAICSALLIPFPDPQGGFMDHIRLKVFPVLQDGQGRTIKYLQPRHSGVRLFFPRACLGPAMTGDGPLWLVEGEKKALAVAQLGLTAVGFCGIEGWHRGGSRELLADFDALRLRGRTVELVPDGDWWTNPAVARGAQRLAQALDARGARVRLVMLPEVL